MVAFPVDLPTKILLVEDDPSLNMYFARALKRSHVTDEIDQVSTVAGAQCHLAESKIPYDVVVVDRTLPDGDGLELIPTIRNFGLNTKICLLAPKNEPEECAYGLNQGADSYLAKPVSAYLLGAQVHAMIRRRRIDESEIIQRRDLHLLEARRLAIRHDASAHLTRRESQFLTLFLRSQHGHVTIEELLTLFWRSGGDVADSVVHTTVQRLRKKLEPLQVGIRSLYGMGYQLQLG